MGLFKKVVEETIWMRKSNAILPSTDSKSNSFADLLTARNYEHVLQMLQNKNSQSKNHINLTLAVEKLLETKQEILAHQTDSLRDKNSYDVTASKYYDFPYIYGRNGNSAIPRRRKSVSGKV